MTLGPRQQRFIELLRSGKLPQTQGTLHLPVDDDYDRKAGYCCLGVACVAAEEDGVRVGRFHGDPGKILGGTLSGQPDVLLHYGFRNGDGAAVADEDALDPLREYLQTLKPGIDPDEPGTGLRLSSLNDEHGLTFAQIADVLEKFPHLYFTEPK